MMGDVEGKLATLIARLHPAAEHVEIAGFMPIPGGFSRETYRFDAIVRSADGEATHPLILRKDPPEAVAILHTSRADEHDLIESVRRNTSVPVTESLGYEMDRSVFGEAAMILRCADGSPTTSNLFNGGCDADQVDDVIRHLCESLVELHQSDIAAIDPGGKLDDPRGVGIDTSSWDSYMDSTFEYYINGYDDIDFDPSICILLDAFLTLRRNKPRPLPLSVVHGDFNPANFLYADGRVTALIDWENSRIGDPREDLGWMVMMDSLSNTSVMSHPVDEGGFLAYYNKLTGLDISEQEIGYFILFGTANIAVPVNSAIKRRIAGQSTELLHLYLVQSSAPALIGIARLLQYPGVPA
ncbi:MAG: phosphotransferase family protein [Ilumatobacter sp.]|uniref:phosphotransferase family protein n=1 Tax=Ilumatobacter sp. TaxID=1967498 RepID=UPI003C7527B8